MLDLANPITRSRVLQFYKRPEIQKAIVEAAQDKEIAIKGMWNYKGKKYEGFLKRPDILKFPNDVMEFALKGATSFHASEELWYNPLELNASLKPKELEELRMGWDLVIDIDCAFLEYSKIAAHLVIQALKEEGVVKSLSCKFSGNHGFHIGIPFEAFPPDVAGVEARTLFPKIPMRVALYLKDKIEKKLADMILEFEGGDISGVIEKTGKEYDELVDREKLEFKMDNLLEIDTILISSRHLYRMPYSFNEKSGLVSFPIDPENVLNFDKTSAEPEKVTVSDFIFLDRDACEANEAKDLFQKTDDYIAVKETTKQMNEEAKETYKKKEYDEREFETIVEKIPEELFPPCILLAKEGIEDGKKRGLFALTNFLTSVGWNYDDVEAWLREWNKNNEEQHGEGLREVNIIGQIRYHKQRKKIILPPNCDNKNYYKSIGTSKRAICQPDALCSRIKNPVQYAKRKVYFLKQDEKSSKQNIKKSKKEQKSCSTNVCSSHSQGTV